MNDNTAIVAGTKQPRKGIFAEGASSALRTLLAIAVLAALYFVGSNFSLSLALYPGFAAPFWPAAGIALAALILYGRRLWPGVLIGSFLVNATVAAEGPGGASLLLSLGVAASIGVGATLQALLGARLVEPLLHRDPELLHANTTLGILSLGGPASCLVSATWGISSLAISGLIRPEDMVFILSTWWVGDSIGVLLLLPIALILMGQPRENGHRRILQVALPMTLTTMAVAFAFSLAGSEEKRRQQLEFEHHADLIGEALTKQFARYLDVLHAIENFFQSSDEVTREEFHTFVNHTIDRVPGIQAIGWNPRVLSAQRAALEKRIRDEGFPSFRVTEIGPDGGVVTAGERDTYVLVQYIEPFDGNETAIGLDIYANPARHQALDQARDTGQAVATRAITLVQETGEQQGVLVAVPHYSGVDAPSSMEQRRAQLLGFIVGVFRMDDVFSAALSGLGIRNIDARLYDETLVDDVTLLASHVFDEAGVGTRAAPGQDQSPSQGLSWSREYLMAGRQWRAIVAPTPAYFSGRRPWYSWVVLAGGLSLTGMLGLFLIALTGRQLQTTRQASELASFNEALQNEVTKRKQMQRALYQEKERIEVTLHSIGDAVITTDAKGMIEFINPAAEELTE